MSEDKAQRLFNTFFMLNKEVKDGRDKCMRLNKEEIYLICEGLSKIEGVSATVGEDVYVEYKEDIEKRVKSYEDTIQV